MDLRSDGSRGLRLQRRSPVYDDVQWLHEKPTPWLGAVIVAQAGAALLLGWLALTLGDWLAGVFALIAAGGALWHCSVLVRTRRARAQGAVPLQGIGRRANPGHRFASKATHYQGARSRDGMVIIVDDLVAFVPTTPWRHLLPQFFLALFAFRVPITRIVMVRLPESREELVALVDQEQGLFVDGSWGLHRSGGMLIRGPRHDVLTVDMPAQYATRWPQISNDAVAARRLRTKILLGSSTVVVALVGIGAIARVLTGNPDYLVAGLCFAGIVIVGVGGGLWVSRDACRIPPA